MATKEKQTITKEDVGTLTLDPNSQALAISPRGALAVPDYLKAEVGNAGSENVTSDDLLIPRLAQAQALSPQLNKNKDVYNENLELGDLFNTATGEIYGSELKVIPLTFFSDFIEFNPLEQGGGIVKRYARIQDVPPADLEYTDDGKGGSDKPKVTHFRNRLCFVWDGSYGLEPIIVSAKHSGRKMMSGWNVTILKKGVNAFCQVYDISSIHRSNKSFEWEGLKADFAGFVPPELLPIVKEKLAQLQAQPIQVNYEGADTEEGDAKEPVEGDTAF